MPDKSISTEKTRTSAGSTNANHRHFFFIYIKRIFFLMDCQLVQNDHRQVFVLFVRPKTFPKPWYGKPTTIVPIFCPLTTGVRKRSMVIVFVTYFDVKDQVTDLYPQPSFFQFVENENLFFRTVRSLTNFFYIFEF